MPVEKKAVVGAINVVIHPHSKDKYIELFKEAEKLLPVNLRGDSFAQLAHVKAENSSIAGMNGLVTAEVYRYTEIDQSQRWFDKKNRKFLDDADVEDINLPEYASPNSAKFSIIFDPVKHVLFYEGFYDGKNFSPKTAELFFDKLFSNEKIVNKFGKVKVDHAPTKDKVEELIEHKNKKKLIYQISRPNPDDLDSLERKYLEAMEAKGVSEIRQEYKSQSDNDIQMDEEMKTTARIASRNGSFVVRFVDSYGQIKQCSTEQYPFQQKKSYDMNELTPYDKFKQMVLSLVASYSDWFK